MLRELQEETRHGKVLGLSLEEVVVRGVGDHCGLVIVLDFNLLQIRLATEITEK